MLVPIQDLAGQCSVSGNDVEISGLTVVTVIENPSFDAVWSDTARCFVCQTLYDYS